MSAPDATEARWPDKTPEQKIQAIVAALSDEGVDECTPEEAEAFMLALVGETRAEAPMELLEAAWQIISTARDGGAIGGPGVDRWRAAYRGLVAEYAAGRAGQAAETESGQAPPPRLANVEVKGFRDLGVVALSETNLAGVPFLHAESHDGSAADFPASSVHFIAWLPQEPKAITSRGARFGEDDGDEERYPDLHIPACQDEECEGECQDGAPF